MRNLLEEGLLDGGAASIYGDNLADCAVEPFLSGNDILQPARRSLRMKIFCALPAILMPKMGAENAVWQSWTAVIKISAVEKAGYHLCPCYCV